MVPRNVSLLILSLLVLVAGVLFFYFIGPFFFPILFAAVLVLLCRPMYDRTVELLRGHRRIAATVMTLAILLVGFLPLTGVLVLAGSQLVSVGTSLLDRLTPSNQSADTGRIAKLKELLAPEEFEAVRHTVLAGRWPSTAIKPDHKPEAHGVAQELENSLTIQELESLFREDARLLTLDSQEYPRLSHWLTSLQSRLSPGDADQIRQSLFRASDGLIKEIYDGTRSFVADVMGFVIGLAIMALALYYFFADGPRMLDSVQQIIPMEYRDEVVLFRHFDEVCRGVVLGTLFSAFIQAGLAGIGFAAVGIESLWLLTVLTMFFSMVPFVGAAGVWLPVVGYLVFQERYMAAGLLALWGGLVVSLSDNVVKVYVIHGRAKLHPLVVLVTMLGALKVVGLWGIFVGPVVAAFFYALLKLLRERLSDAARTSDPPHPPPPSPQAPAEALAAGRTG